MCSMETVSVTMPEATHRRLKEISDERNLSVADILDQSLTILQGHKPLNDSERVLQVIEDHPLITRNAITRKTQWLEGGAKQRNKILGDLIDSGEASYTYKPAGRNGKRTQVFWRSI